MRSTAGKLLQVVPKFSSSKGKTAQGFATVPKGIVQDQGRTSEGTSKDWRIANKKR